MKERLKQLPKYYKRMTTIILLLFEKDDVISRGILLNKLIDEKLKLLFEKIYQNDCNCSGEWSFFDYSDRFTRFANVLIKHNIVKKV